MKYIKKNRLSAAYTSIDTFYNSPWTLPFLRCNAIMIALTDQSAISVKEDAL